ncbi:MAG: XdhC family protein [Oscillospiraceae bacterium]|nr:XdhC family protein [Oscillospiraceae bacterium]
MRKLLEQSLNRLRAGEPVVWCVILAAEGSTPRGVGAKMAVFADGSSCGTVGGGAVELQAAAFARGLGDRAVIRSYDLYSGGSTATGMICGGRVELGFLPFPPRSAELLAGILEALEEPRGRGLRLWISPDGAFGLSLAEDADRTSGEPRLPKAPLCARQPDGSICLTEPLAPDYRIYLFGGGHVSAALVPVLLPLGFPVTVIDPRPELADPARFPGAWVIRGDFEPFPAAVKVTERDYIVVMTPGHEHDLAVLRQALRTPASYIGCIGSRKKTAYVNQALAAEGFPPAQLERIHAPIGLPIGARTPEEIAVSIAAQLILHRAAHP